jgi:hypothetical protein
MLPREIARALIDRVERRSATPKIVAREDYNVLAGGRVRPELLKFEPSLSGTAWYDYRFQHPAERTALFAQHFKQQYSIAYCRYFDHEEGKLKEGIAKGNLFLTAQRTLISLWRARQTADCIGVPYELYVSRAIESLLRGRMKRPPRPNQIFDNRTAKKVLDDWWEYCGAKVFYSSLPAYRNENFRGEAAQIAHHDWIVVQIKRRHSPPYLIAKFCYEEQLLPMERALHEFGEERLAKARSAYSGSVPSAVAVPKLSELRPGCFSVPHAYQTGDAACGACLHREPCELSSSGAVAAIVAKFGSDDPVCSRQKMKARDRQRRLRAKRRAVGTPASALRV